MTPSKVFRIRDKDTGLFSTGGMSPGWTKYGKAWSSVGHLKNHLRCWLYGEYRNRAIPDNWEVVEYEVVQSENGTYPAQSLING